jgi:hypothetical protein
MTQLDIALERILRDKHDSLDPAAVVARFGSAF